MVLSRKAFNKRLEAAFDSGYAQRDDEAKEEELNNTLNELRARIEDLESKVEYLMEEMPEVKGN